MYGSRERRDHFQWETSPKYIGINWRIFRVVLVGDHLVVRVYCSTISLAWWSWTEWRRTIEVLFLSGLYCAYLIYGLWFVSGMLMVVCVLREHIFFEPLYMAYYLLKFV